MFPTQIHANPTNKFNGVSSYLEEWVFEYGGFFKLSIILNPAWRQSLADTSSYYGKTGHAHIALSHRLSWNWIWDKESIFGVSSRILTIDRLSKNTCQPPEGGIVWVSRTEAKQDTLNLRFPVSGVVVYHSENEQKGCGRSKQQKLKHTTWKCIDL